MKTVTDYFGCDVFSASVMKERLPQDVYEEFQRTLDTGHRLNIEVANVIANATLWNDSPIHADELHSYPHHALHAYHLLLDLTNHKTVRHLPLVR